MKINHQWKATAAKRTTPPTYIPYAQHLAEIKIVSENSYDFTVQLICDLACLAVHEAYGFKTDHIRKFAEALVKEIDHFAKNVEWEVEAETAGKTSKERKAARPDLAYTMEELDRRLAEINPNLKPFQQRYGNFGGRLSWTSAEGSAKRAEEILKGGKINDRK